MALRILLASIEVGLVLPQLLAMYGLLTCLESTPFHYHFCRLDAEPCEPLQAPHCACSICLCRFLCKSICTDLHVSYTRPLVTFCEDAHVLSSTGDDGNTCLEDTLLLFVISQLLHSCECSSPNAVKSSPSKLSYLYQCVGCDFFHSQRVGRMSNKVLSSLVPTEILTATCFSCAFKSFA